MPSACTPATARRSTAARQPARPDEAHRARLEPPHQALHPREPAAVLVASELLGLGRRPLHEVGHADAATASAARVSRATVTRPAAIAAGQKRLPGAREPDAHVGREHRRVQAADEQAHAGTDGVGQRAGAPDPGLDPERIAGVDRARLDVEAGADQHVDQGVGLPRREPPPREVVVVELAVGRARVEQEVRRRADRERAVEVGEGELAVARAGRGGSSHAPSRRRASRGGRAAPRGRPARARRRAQPRVRAAPWRGRRRAPRPGEAATEGAARVRSRGRRRPRPRARPPPASAPGRGTGAGADRATPRRAPRRPARCRAPPAHHCPEPGSSGVISADSVS